MGSWDRYRLLAIGSQECGHDVSVDIERQQIHGAVAEHKLDTSPVAGDGGGASGRPPDGNDVDRHADGAGPALVHARLLNVGKNGIRPAAGLLPGFEFRIAGAPLIETIGGKIEGRGGKWGAAGRAD